VATAQAWNPAFRPHRVAGYVALRLGDRVILVKRDRVVWVDGVYLVINR
jgi:hypothetical protein